MPLYNLTQTLSQVSTYAGIQNENNAYYPSATTFPSEDLMIDMVNDSIREICGDWEYTFLETTRSYPFYHVVSGVQSVYLSGSNTLGSGISGTITPYPSDVLNYAWTAHNTVQNISNNFSGIAFTGTDVSGVSWTGISNSGNVTTCNWTGVGYQYQLDPDIDKFYVPGIWCPASNNDNSAKGVLLKNIDFEDMMRIFPIGNIAASGTPIYYSEAPGISTANNNGKQIIFGPTPTLTGYSGNNFVCFYKKLHQDLVNDTDTQQVIPIQWQNVIIKLTAAKVLAISDPSRYELVMKEAVGLIRSMKLWDAKQPSKVRRIRDSNYDTNSSFIYDSSVWFSLSGSGR